MKRTMQAALWRGFWGKATAVVVALAAVAPASPGEVAGWLHALAPWLPLWVVQPLALAVLVARILAVVKAREIADSPEDRRRR